MLNSADTTLDLAHDYSAFECVMPDRQKGGRELTYNWIQFITNPD